MGVAWVSREIRCDSAGPIPWGADDTRSVKLVSRKRVRGRGGVIPVAGLRRQDTSEGHKPKEAPTSNPG
jgi:hypothetical protein